MEPLPPRQHPPKDGFGPRGAPDCYYTSRVLDSTHRYVKFIKKLRTLEEEQNRGTENLLKELKDKQYSDFFIRCDRRLKDLLTAEEEMNIRKFVLDAQEGSERLWQAKKDRLAFLLAKRKKEHEDKYSALPLSKVVHVHPCIVARRAVEASRVQQYQMKEHQARKMAEIEIDKMWHEVSMKESEALAARMEMDAIMIRRRDHECKEYDDNQVALNKAQRKKEQEILKQEALKMKELIDEENRKEEADACKQHEKRVEANRELKDMIKERKATLATQEADAKRINDTWESLAGEVRNEEELKDERRRQKKRELDKCNKELATVKNDKPKMEAADNILLQKEAQRRLDVADEQRCGFLQKSEAATKTSREGIVEQIKEKQAARELKAKENAEYIEYERQVSQQLEQLVAHKEMTNEQAKKLYQTHLQEQIQYNKLLKDRAMEEELNQRKKFQIATDEYDHEIKAMLCRTYYSDAVNPFLITMNNNLQMRDNKCPCSRPDNCAVPVLPKVSLKGAPKASSSKY